jgi:hypothetical protein
MELHWIVVLTLDKNMDVSGSMAENVANSKGQQESKFNIASRSLVALGNRLDDY